MPDDRINNKFFKTYDETKNWLDKMGIKKYEINKDTLVVDVDGDVWLDGKGLQYIQVKFGIVKGSFKVGNNADLKSLIGRPDSMDYLHCYFTRIKSFNGLDSVESVVAYGIQSLESFEGLPNELYFLNISNSCHNVNSFDHFPKIIRDRLFIGPDFKWSDMLYKHMDMCGEIALVGNIEDYNNILKLLYIKGVKAISLYSVIDKTAPNILNAEIQRQPDPRKRNLLKVAQELSNAGFHHLTAI